MKRERKEKLTAQLQKTPIVQVACDRTTIARATYYRWRKEDKKFRDQADKAIRAGEKLVNDMAESQLISAIRDRHMTAIIFWLKNHHKKYATRVEVTTRLKKKENLTPEQEVMVSEALRLAGLLEDNQEADEEPDNTK